MFLQIELPEFGDPFFNNSKGGGISTCIDGNGGGDPGRNVLPNCVGGAAGCYNKAACEDLKNPKWGPLMFPPNAEKICEYAASIGLPVSDEPAVGSLIVWSNRHVAFIYQVDSDGTIHTSESAWTSKTVWMNRTYKPPYRYGSGYCVGFVHQPKGGNQMEKNGIDVSAHQGIIDWKKVKAAGISFAILRAGYGKVISQKDKCFEDNYKGATEAGVDVGAYWYSYATTVDEAKQEADVCIEVLKGKQYPYPIWFDLEDKDALYTGKGNCSAMARAFCEKLEAAGYWAGIYASRSVLQSYLEESVKSRFALWAAEWGDRLNYTGAVGMWQKSESGRVNGIDGNVDLDIAYVDYPKKIKERGLNGFGTTPPPDEPDDENEIPFEMVLNGQKYAGTLKKL